MPSEQMRQVLDTLRARRAAEAGRPPLPLAEVRETFLPAAAPHPMPEDVRVSEVDAGGARAHWLDAPGVRPDRVLLFLHGGGFQLGSLRSDGELASRLGRASGARVLFVEYRLAPEHPFPAALDDVRAVWEWVRGDQGVPAESAAVSGASAGGGLAVSLLVTVRDEGGSSAAAAVLMSPTVDLTSSGASMTERVEQDFISTPELLRTLAADYLDGADPATPLASPLFAPLEGLPPLLIQVGTADLLFSDGDRLARAAIDAGVDVAFDAAQGLPHVYQLNAETPEAEEAVSRAGLFLRQRFDRYT